MNGLLQYTTYFNIVVVIINVSIIAETQIHKRHTRKMNAVRRENLFASIERNALRALNYDLLRMSGEFMPREQYTAWHDQVDQLFGDFDSYMQRIRAHEDTETTI